MMFRLTVVVDPDVLTCVDVPDMRTMEPTRKLDCRDMNYMRFLVDLYQQLNVEGEETRFV